VNRVFSLSQNPVLTSSKTSALSDVRLSVLSESSGPAWRILMRGYRPFVVVADKHGHYMPTGLSAAIAQSRNVEQSTA